MAIRKFQNIEPTIASNCYVDDNAVVIGDVTLADDVSIWPMAVLRGDVNFIKIGRCSNIQDGTVIHVTHKSMEEPDGAAVIVGAEVTIGHKVILHGCQVQDRVLVGMGSKILDNALIESNVIIGAGSLVSPNKILKSGYLYFGTPVQQIRPLTQEELDFLPYSAEHYVRLKNQY